MSNLKTVLKKFPRVFWVSNVMELFERWAWYGLYNSLALYLILSKESGALGFTQVQKGTIMGTGTMLLYFLPLITGAISDRIGYKKVLILSFTMYIAGYISLGTFESYTLVFASYIFLAVAGALFKPIISGMIAKTTNNETSSVGFGIFYMMINIGGFIGPFIAGFVYKVNWNYVFALSVITIAINYIFVFFFFKEPDREPSDNSFFQNVGQAFKNIYKTLTNWKYVIFLLIMSLFWTAFNQLYYTFPVFLEQWVDLDKISLFLGMPAGKITAVTVLSMDAFYIIVLMLYISSISMRYKPLNSMITGTVILGAGLILMFLTRNPWVVLFGVLVFAIGEMASSPKYTEYVGRIAPLDQKALYMGTSFLPVAMGHFLAGWISGRPFEVVVDKLFLLKRAVVENGFSIPDISDSFTQTHYFQKAEELFGMDGVSLTNHLWSVYGPYKVLYQYAGLAFFAALLLYVYDRFILKSISNQ